jgi:hypothetical protein
VKVVMGETLVSRDPEASPTTPSLPGDAGDLTGVYVNGVERVEGAGYTTGVDEITLTPAPVVGDVVVLRFEERAEGYTVE